jgi:hypothetical protein
MKDNLINRRSFFKKVATAALPIVAAIAIPSLLTSCKIDEPFPEGGSTGCKSACSGKCSSSCSGLCTRSCATTCKAQSINTTGCNQSCKGHCYASCKGTCSSSSK